MRLGFSPLLRRHSPAGTGWLDAASFGDTTLAAASHAILVGLRISLMLAVVVVAAGAEMVPKRPRL